VNVRLPAADPALSHGRPIGFTILPGLLATADEMISPADRVHTNGLSENLVEVNGPSRIVSLSVRFCCACSGLLMAQSGHPRHVDPCPLLGVKQTSCRDAPMSAYDPKQTCAVEIFRSAI
jgi:hypothetical protein